MTSQIKSITNILLVACFIVAISMPACKHDPILTTVDPVDTMKMDTMIPPDTSLVCHPDTIYFRKDVLPIILSSCGMELCHDPVTKQAGFELVSYETVITSGKFVPFDPDASLAYQMMTESDLTNVMPPSPRGPISDTNISVIRRWIEQGALNLTCPEDTVCNIDPPVRFSKDVFPVIDKYCIGCHSGANPWAGLYLRDYDEINVIASSGQLVSVISHEVGFPQMPKNMEQLSPCIIEKITMWVNDGAPDN